MEDFFCWVCDLFVGCDVGTIDYFDPSPQLPAVAQNIWDQTEAKTPGVLSRVFGWLANQSLDVVKNLAGKAVSRALCNEPPAVQNKAKEYLTQLPAQVRRSLRRPTDPAGATIPPYLKLRRAEDLLPFLPTRMPHFQPGQRPLPGMDLELVELLGVGGFGEVWKARNPLLSSVEPVALKFCLDPQAAKLLRHEAAVLDRVMRKGKHPGIVQLRHTYLSADPPCLEYEFVAGGDLGGLILEWHKGKKIPSAAEAARVMLRLAEIVGFAHAQNPPIVHRDLKPTNVLVQRSANKKLSLRVTDFGIGGVAAGQAVQQTRLGTIKSAMLTTAFRGSHSPLYASPQQIQGETPDPTDDIFSLGVIWYQLLTGDLNTGRPGGTLWTRRLAQRQVPAAMIDLLAACFEDNPRDRPQDAGCFAVLLKQASELAKSVEATPVNDQAMGAMPLPWYDQPGIRDVFAENFIRVEMPESQEAVIPEEGRRQYRVAPRQTPGRFSTQRTGSALAVFYSILQPLGLIIVVLGMALIGNASYSTSVSYWDPNYYGWGNGGYRQEYRHHTDYEQQGFGGFLCVLGVLAELTASILFLVWLYKVWSIVPPEYGEPSPGMAVGLLFVPFFNLYWMFRVIPGLSAALERMLVERDPSSPHRTGSGVGLAACILALIPCVSMVNIILFPIWLNIANSAKNRVIQS